MNDIDNSADVINVSDLTDRVDELRSDLNLDSITETQEEIDDLDPNDDAAEIAETQAEIAQMIADQDADDKAELALIEGLLERLKGYGGNHQWEGDWYPNLLIRRSHFVEYAEQYAEDVGAINSDSSWPNNCLDWDKAAAELETDYSSEDYDGVEYLYN